jgi:hypothetical protein
MNIITQKDWSEAELRGNGFQRYRRFKQVVMVRYLPESEAPLTIYTEWGETLVAEAGYAICYTAGDDIQATRNEYFHWPVDPQIFEKTYRLWDVEDWQPTATEAHLMTLGCQPFYKAAHVWAKEIIDPIWIQSPEHQEPVEVGSGRFLAIGAQGEPYAMSTDDFNSRYELDV